MMQTHLDITVCLEHTSSMRTTISIDDDLLAAAKSLDRSRSVPVGRVISDLARRGLQAPVRTRKRGGFPVFDVPANARPITLDDVKKLEDEA